MEYFLTMWLIVIFIIKTENEAECQTLIPNYKSKHSLCVSAALFEGYGVHVNVSVPKAVVRLPFPQSVTWYLTLQLMCNR